MISEAHIDARVPATVVDAAIAGDTLAFARIVQAHHNDMVRVCQVICGDPDLAQDAAQAAWPIAWKRLGTLRDRASLRPWLVTIAANRARRMRSRRGPLVIAIDFADTASTDGDPARRAEEVDLATALRSLSSDDRALLALRYVAGFDATEIARSLGMSPSGVRSRLSRLVSRLRTELDR